MRRMLFVSFDQPEDVSGRLHIYVGKEKICTLSNHESFDGVELTAGRHVVRAVFGPSTWLLPFARRNVRHAEHAIGAWVMHKQVIPEGGGDWTLSFAFHAPHGSMSGEVLFDFREDQEETQASPGKENQGASCSQQSPAPSEGESSLNRRYIVFPTDTGAGLVHRLYPPAYPGDITYSRALELPYTLLGFVSCDAMPGQRDLSFTWEYLCESPDGNPVLIREEYNVSTETTSPSEIKRKHLYSIEAETLTAAKYNQIRKHYMPSEERKVYLPISLLPEMKDDAFFSRLYDFSHSKVQAAAAPEDHRWKVTVTKDDIHAADYRGPFDYELDDRMTLGELLEYISFHVLLGYGGYEWQINAKGPIGYINKSGTTQLCAPNVSLREAQIQSVHCSSR